MDASLAIIQDEQTLLIIKSYELVLYYCRISPCEADKTITVQRGWVASRGGVGYTAAVVCGCKAFKPR